ncbi:acyltransferase family protein [Kamptonema formosum]|uniref:acyltransferase family protein n=1 Tax=Kamptonema formosum TaxID=331992 RepID=UPI00034AE4B3|nr:acyltransferase [Oscillatoria sp. PCC 10802]
MTAQPVPQDCKRLSQSLPALKGLAIFLVVVYHLWGYTKGYQLASEIAISSFRSGVKGFLEGILNIFCLLGEQGVAIFIIASGFGLASSWWRKTSSPGKVSRPFEIIGFWRRRLLRLLPLYWLAHGVALLQAVVQPAWVPFGREVLNRGATDATAATVASLTTLRNFIPDYYFFLNAAWWYVGLAVQLYLIFPLLVTVGKRWGWTVLLLSSLLIEIVDREIIVALPLNEMATDVLLRGALFPSRLFEFVFGIFLAVAMLEPAPQKPGHPFSGVSCFCKNLLLEKQWLWLSALLYAAGLVFDWASDAGWHTFRVPSDALAGVGEFCLLFQLLNLIEPAKPSLKLLGDYSYGIYLTHMNFMAGLWAVLTPILSNYWLRLSLVAAIACALGGVFELAYQWGQARCLSYRR